MRKLKIALSNFIIYIGYAIRPSDIKCSICQDKGWMSPAGSSLPHDYIICPTCENPNGYKNPGYQHFA